MSRSEFDRFIADIEKDSALKAEVRKLIEARRTEEVQRVVALAASKGYRFTADDVRQSAADKKLTDEELEGVAGGQMTTKNFKSPFEV